ncbi:MAG TPA: glycosyltransferase family 4 protein [Chloroflexota bacterium]|nr:glycosyltransferase family 4 protein [Chloroflexota bacterium]
MRPRRVALLTRGDPEQRTGGYLYNARMVAALRASGAPGVAAVDQIALPDNAGSVEARGVLAANLPALLVVDSIAFEQILPLLGWLRREGVSVVALMHMLPSTQAEDAEQVRRAERAFLRDIDGVIAVSDALAAQLVEAGTAPERVRVVVPGRDGVPVRRRRAGPPDLTRFLTVANWTPNKGIHDAAAAFLGLRASGRRARLDLVGAPGEGAYVDAVRGLLAASAFAGDARVWGGLPPDELSRRYADADVFLLPSRSEGFGIVFAEALSHGLPVIAGRVGPVPALVPDTCGILVPPDDPAALEAAMAQLADDPGLRRRMTLQARRRARQLPTWEESEREFCRIVGDIVENCFGEPVVSAGQAAHARNFGAPKNV